MAAGAASTRRVRVCQVIEATAGGVRKHLRLLIDGLDRERFELSAAVSCGREEGFRADIERFRELGVRVVEVPMAREISPRADWRAHGALKRALRELAPDIVHTHGSKGGFLGRLAARAVGVGRAVHTPHFFAFQWNTGWRRRLYLALERYAARRCDRIVCLSERQKRLTAGSTVMPPERIEVIANGIDPALFPGERSRQEIRPELGLSPDGEVVGMVARLAPQKGCRNFARAAARVIEERPDATFCLVGGGPLEGELRAEVERLGVSERIRMVGHREDAAALYPAFDLFVLSSLWEGLPYVILEAMASGLPVVATRILGNAELVEDGVTGLLASLDSPEDIAARISELLADPDRRRSMGRAGRERVEREFTLARFIEGHERLYMEMAGGRP